MKFFSQILESRYTVFAGKILQYREFQKQKCALFGFLSHASNYLLQVHFST